MNNAGKATLAVSASLPNQRGARRFCLCVAFIGISFRWLVDLAIATVEALHLMLRNLASPHHAQNHC